MAAWAFFFSKAVSFDKLIQGAWHSKYKRNTCERWWSEWRLLQRPCNVWC